MSANSDSTSSSLSSSMDNAGSTPPQATAACGNCGKLEPSHSADTEEDDSKLLKPCIMCKSVAYCSRDCKKADAKKHKKTCALAAQEYARTHEVKMASRAAPKTEGYRGGLQKWQFDT